MQFSFPVLTHSVLKTLFIFHVQVAKVCTDCKGCWKSFQNIDWLLRSLVRSIRRGEIVLLLLCPYANQCRSLGRGKHAGNWGCMHACMHAETQTSSKHKYPPNKNFLQTQTSFKQKLPYNLNFLLLRRSLSNQNWWLSLLNELAIWIWKIFFF